MQNQPLRNKERPMGKKQKVIPDIIKLSQKELLNLLEETHEMGFNKGLHTQSHYEKEQKEDCEYMINDHFNIYDN
jgi:hypothetical protein|tara:strand:+ start:784 stop:1008 length:225 start_codon:yes stop_codon:yes gene_type:complete